MKKAFLFRVLKAVVRAVFPRYTLRGTEHLPDGPYILVGNHAQVHGPVLSQLYLPGENYTWCAGEMFHLKEVPAYARSDFWSGKPRWQQPFFRLASYLIAPLSVFVFGNADVIPVYHDVRILTTMKETVKRLEQGAHVVIFPEGHNLQGNHVVAGLQQGFADVARFYSRKTGRELPFVPMYVAPELHTVCFGTPVYSCKTSGKTEERERISNVLMKAITDLAMELPPHRITPYENIPKKDYPMSRTGSEK